MNNKEMILNLLNEMKKQITQLNSKRYDNHKEMLSKFVNSIK
ncbi:hypothetical protein [Hathewaya limosa]|uniref:Uncharacterized protein n=1 Tax=Hathewaya limosa TaxID=1536 RepID=A0ABU0JRQ9_HATLI|nr:hypothetical protein [Hathewaya limosa]MDQ0479744.1 hypothetical protein [Hathewaya limosa]